MVPWLLVEVSTILKTFQFSRDINQQRFYLLFFLIFPENAGIPCDVTEFQCMVRLEILASCKRNVF